MILTSIRVENWRGLGEIALDDLSPHLNLIAGPNETGKSRIFEAVRFALFESHKGSAKHKKALQSWGGTASPRVEVDFTADGTAYRLEKTFLKGASALLQGGGRTWRDHDAEERLAELLGLAAPPAQKADPSGLSHWPLLWLEQNAAGSAPDRDLNESTRSRIQDLLCAEIGEVAAGPLGDRVLARAREGVSRFWTATFRETGELREAVEAEEHARAERDAGHAKARELREVTDELVRVGDEMSRMDDRLGQARTELEKMRVRAERAREVQLLIERQRTSVQLAQTGKEEAEREAALRQERETSLKERNHELARVEEESRELAGRLERRLAERQSAEADLMEKRAAARRAGDDLRRALRQRERTAIRGELEALRRGLEEVGRVEAELVRLSAEASQIRVTQEVLGRLRRADEGWKRAKAMLEGAAARLRITARTPVEVDGVALESGGAREWLCDAPKTVRIGEAIEVEVRPGGDDLPSLRREERRLGEEVRAQLEACAVTSAEEAQERWERLRDLRNGIVRARERIGELCPEGRVEREAAISALEVRLADLGADDPGAPSSEEAQDAAARATETAEAAQAHRDGVAEELTTLQNTRSELDGRRTQLRQEASRLGGLLEAMASLEALDAWVAEKTAAWQEALAGRSGLEEEFRKAGGESAAGDLERARAALRQLEARGAECRELRSRLLGRLQTLQGEGVHERLQEAETRWDQARARLEQARRWAKAYRRLLETLERARTEVQERLTAPVAERVAPYLQRIFPGSRLRLSEDLEVEGLRTGDVPEPFADLSGGAREQVSVIVRLGLAELFAGDGTLPVALDDALTNTDFGRVRRMHSVLYEVSRRLQLLVFTCHEEAFDGLGADRVYLLTGGRSLG